MGIARVGPICNDARRECLHTVYGAEPEIQLFDVHAVVYNDAHTMLRDTGRHV